MLGTVLTILRLKVTSLISYAMKLIQRLLLKITGVLIAMKTLFVGSLTNLLFQFALIQLKLKALLVNLTTVASSIKLVLTTVKAKAIQIGSLLLTTVRKILQRAKALLKPKA